MRLLRILKMLGLGAVLMLTSGCWYHYHYAHGPAPVRSNVVYIRKAPPAPHHYSRPPRPTASAIWISGYWNWTGVKFTWVSGYWERHPPRNKRWRDGRWVHTARGWYWVPGGWY